MRRKNLAACVAAMLSALSFIIIGSCFSAFKYKDEIIKVSNPRVFCQQSISVFNEDGDKTIDTLKLSELKLGLKPATGEEDPDTSIPSTVHDKKGSEGQYACFKIYAPSGAKVVIRDIKIENSKDQEKAEAERKNIFVALKEVKSTKNIAENEVVLGEIKASDERQAMTFYVWLSAKASDDLESSTISFNIYFDQLS